MMDTLKWENEILQHSTHAPRRATPRCLARSHCGRTTPTSPPPPHQQLLTRVGSQLPNANGHAQSQNADNQHPILLVNAPNVSQGGRVHREDPAGHKEAAPCCWVCGREVQFKQGGRTGDGDNGRGDEWEEEATACCPGCVVKLPRMSVLLVFLFRVCQMSGGPSSVQFLL